MSKQELARNARVEAWLAQGGIVLAATDRAARAVAGAFHAARRAENRSAWPTPAIFAWESWVRELWLERNRSGLMLLNPLQEQTIWARMIRDSETGEGLLHPDRLAAAAQQAYRLLTQYAPGSLTSSSRSGWQGDGAVFSEWLNAFESHCRREGFVSGSQLALQLTEAIRKETLQAPLLPREPLLLIGFDRILETQRFLLNAWGEWQLDSPRDEVAEQSALSSDFWVAPDAATEAAACAQWLRKQIFANPQARLMVLTPNLQDRRGELERALLETLDLGDPELYFEFSLGVPLGRVGIARGGLLLLRWLHESLSEAEVDWLVTSDYSAAGPEEEIALAQTMLELRRRGREQPSWSLEEFLGSPSYGRAELAPPRKWIARMTAARKQLQSAPRRQSALEWVRLAGLLLETMDWPGFRPESTIGFQARQRWESVLDDCGSLGFDGSQMDWREFVSTISAAVSASIFATESTDASIQITEPLVSAGQLADGIWFLGAHEDNWPGRGAPHPLLPIGLQREMGMPHASPQADWNLAQEATLRLLSSADKVVFSYAQQSGDSEMRPSRLVTQHLGSPEPLLEELSGAGKLGERLPVTETFADQSQIRFPHEAILGGSATLTSQSLCPFQAFATSRLGAKIWQPAEVGLDAKQRGRLLHDVLHQVWTGRAQGGISSLEELREIADIAGFVRPIVSRVMRESFDPARRNSLPARFPERFLELESKRLTRLVSEWMAYESERKPFVVEGTEVKSQVRIAGLNLNLRMDRIDVLVDGSRMIIDYKSSDVGSSAWVGDRPDDVQLPLYAALSAPSSGDRSGPAMGGLVYGRVKPGKVIFNGRVRDARGTLLNNTHSGNLLVKNPLTDRQLEEWRIIIQRLGEDFLAGKAEVDPKDPAKTCERCHLHAVCRIYENQPLGSVLVADEDIFADGSDDVGSGDA